MTVGESDSQNFILFCQYLNSKFDRNKLFIECVNNMESSFKSVKENILTKNMNSYEEGRNENHYINKHWFEIAKLVKNFPEIERELDREWTQILEKYHESSPKLKLKRNFKKLDLTINTLDKEFRTDSPSKLLPDDFDGNWI